MTSDRTWLRTLALGTATGLRSMLGPAFLSWSASRGELDGIEEKPFAPLASLQITKALALLTAGEFIADKTPVIPSRTSAPVLVQRAAFGAAVGAALYAVRRLDGRIGASLGAAAAVAGALAGHGFRQVAGQTEAPPLLPAFLEDALALGLGLLSLRDVRR